MKDIRIIDTHEHLPAFEKDRPRRDVISEFLAHYFRVDLVSAGLSAELCDLVTGDALNVLEKWLIVEKYWEASQYTGYGQALTISARELYGIDRISRDTIEELNNAFIKSFNEDHYKKVLKEKSNIKVSILDTYDSTACDPDYFIPANHIDGLIQPQSANQVEELGQKTGVRIEYVVAVGHPESLELDSYSGRTGQLRRRDWTLTRMEARPKLKLLFLTGRIRRRWRPT